jgi:ABC-type nitrate/sulfonate/bicarbonate transport system ATPase subunit
VYAVGPSMLGHDMAAVDAPVAEHLLTEAVAGFLRGTTRVLVTHQVAMTRPLAQHTVVLDREGQCS